MSERNQYNTHTISSDYIHIQGGHAGNGGNVHITAPTGVEVIHENTVKFDIDVKADKLKNKSGEDILTSHDAGHVEHHKSSLFTDNADFQGTASFSGDVSFSGASVTGLTVDTSTLALTAADIASSNVTGSIDSELDTLQLAVNANTSARQNLPVNRLLQSNSAGLLAASTIDPQRIIDTESRSLNNQANNITVVGMAAQNATDISSLQTTTAGLQTTTTGHSTDISSLQTTTAGLQTTTTGHSTDISSLQTTTAGLQTTTAGHSTDISSLQTTTAGHTASITNNAADVLSLQTTTGGHSTDISSLQTTTGTLQSDVNTLQTDVQTNLNNIATNTLGITANVTTINNNSTAITAIQTDVQSNTQAITTNGTAITALQTDVTAIQADYVATNSNATLGNVTLGDVTAGDVTAGDVTTDGHTITQSTTAGVSNSTSYSMGTRSSSSTASGVTTTTAVTETARVYGDHVNSTTDGSVFVSIDRTTQITEVDDASGFTTVYPSTTVTKRMLEINDTYTRSNGTFEMPNNKQELLFMREAAVAGQSPVYDADAIFRVGRNSSPNENNILREGCKVYEPNLSAISNPHPTDGTLFNNDLSASKGEYRVITYNSLFSNYVIPKFKELLVNGGIHQVANFDPSTGRSTDSFSTTFKNEVIVAEHRHFLSFHTGEGSMLEDTNTDNTFTVQCESTFNKNINLGSGVDILDSSGNSVLTGSGGGGSGGGSLLSSNNVWTGTNQFSAGLSLSSAETIAQRTQTGGGFVFNNDLYQPAGVTGDGLFTRMSSAETTAANQLVLIGANTTDIASNTTELLQCVKLTGSQSISGQKTFTHGNTLFDSNINIQNNKELRIQNSVGDIAYLRYSLLKALESPVEYITYGTTTSASAPKILVENGIVTGAGSSSTSHYAPLSLHAITHGTFLQIQLRGLLYLTGTYSGSSSNETLFTLPSGYRPAKFHSYVVRTTSTASGETDDSTSLVTIDSNGVCKYRSNSGSAAANTAPETFYDMASVSFFTN